MKQELKLSRAQAAAFVSVASQGVLSATWHGPAIERGTAVAAAGREAAAEATGTDARIPAAAATRTVARTADSPPHQVGLVE